MLNKIIIIIALLLMMGCEKKPQSFEFSSELSKIEKDMSVVKIESSLNINEQNFDGIIKLGMNIALSGIKAHSDDGMLKGAELFLDKINSSGGILGKKVEIFAYDNQSSIIGAKLATEKAVEDKVVAMIGAIRSSQSLAMAPILQKSQIPMISPNSTIDSLTMMGDYIFRVCFTDEFQGKKLAEYAFFNLKAQNVAIIELEDEKYSEVLSEEFTKNFKSNGGNIVIKEYYKSKDMDFEKLLDKINKADPDLIFLPGYSKDSGLIIRQARNMGIETQFLGGDGWGLTMLEYSDKMAIGAISSTHWHKDINLPLSKDLKTSYLKRYDNKIVKSASTPLTFDSFWVLADAIERAGSLDGSKIKDALFQTENLEGTTGYYSFDKYGNPLKKNLVIVKFLEDKDELLELFTGSN